MRKPLLTFDDIEQHFADLCGEPDTQDPFAGAKRFARTFAGRHTKVCLRHVENMQRDMEGADHAE